MQDDVIWVLNIFMSGRNAIAVYGPMSAFRETWDAWLNNELVDGQVRKVEGFCETPDRSTRIVAFKPDNVEMMELIRYS